jgi:hypothetical protein
MASRRQRDFNEVAFFPTVAYKCPLRLAPGRSRDLMKRLAVWAFYGIGTLAVLYLALYAYAAFTGRELEPGDPIHIFRKPDAPSYS